MFYRLVIKKYLDIFIALFTLIILLPILLILGILNFILNGNPIFFKQDRPGYKGKLFTLIKFRTMDLETNSFISEEKRLSSFGKFLRKTSLDELPSIINIIKGELSFIGPRPLLKSYLPRYSRYQLRRHEVLPGLSGLAQVKGRNLLDWEKKLEYDVSYVDNQSFWLDLRILTSTFLIILKREGISPKGSEIMPEFNPKNK